MIAVEQQLTAVGQQAPDFTLRSQDDKLVSLSDYAGSQNVILYFTREFR